MKSLELDGKTILVTGADGFLGRHLTKTLLEEGANVIGIDIRKSSTSDAVNISDSKDVSDYTNELRKQNIVLDGIINNAALNFKAKTIPDEDFDKTLRANITGTNNIISKLSSIMSDKASIVNISSIYASRSPDFSIYDGNEELYSNISYGASKAGIEQITRYYAKLLGPKIRVNAIAPGGIFQDHSDDFVNKYSRIVPLKRMANPEEIVNAILFLLSPLAGYISGHILKVDGGMNA